MKKLLISIVKLYKKFISPLHMPCCKYYPSCSSYAITAIEKHGAVKGTILAAWRILRCNPYSNGGIDYVPDKFHLYTLKSEALKKAAGNGRLKRRSGR